MLEREDPVTFAQKANDADFETELEFERRVRKHGRAALGRRRDRIGQAVRVRTARRTCAPASRI